MIPTKSINNLQSIMLDTSVVLDFLKLGSKDPILSRRIEFTHNLIDWLVNEKTEKKDSRIFYISTITISEINILTDNQSLTQKIVEALNTTEVEFLPFNTTVALHFNRTLGKYIPTNKLNELARELDYSPNNLVLARELIFRDYMIMATASCNNIDVILTADEKTFVPMANQVKIPCLPTNPNHAYFNQELFKKF